MFRFISRFVCVIWTLSASGAWYWPFGEDDATVSTNSLPRLSELMEPVSTNIDAAADLAASGKSSEAITSYRKALAELDRIVRENPERVKSPEFSTVKTKRAYIDAAIDSILLQQAQRHVKAVMVTGTDTLEMRLELERLRKRHFPAVLASATVKAASDVRLASCGDAELAAAVRTCVRAELAIPDLTRIREEDSNFDKIAIYRELAGLHGRIVGRIDSLCDETVRTRLEPKAKATAEQISRLVPDASKKVEPAVQEQVDRLNADLSAFAASISNDVWAVRAEAICQETAASVPGLVADVVAKAEAADRLVAQGKRIRTRLGYEWALLRVPDIVALTNGICDAKCLLRLGETLRELVAERDELVRCIAEVVAGKDPLASRTRPVNRAAERLRKAPVAPDRQTLRERALAAIARKDWDAAMLNVDGMLAARPNGAAALNLKAVIEIGKGDLRSAEKTLDSCLRSNPRNAATYYNLARLMLLMGDPASARRYYRAGRSSGGRRDSEIEGGLR